MVSWEAMPVVARWIEGMASQCQSHLWSIIIPESTLLMGSTCLFTCSVVLWLVMVQLVLTSARIWSESYIAHVDIQCPEVDIES